MQHQHEPNDHITKSPLKKPAAHHASSTGAAQRANLSSD